MKLDRKTRTWLLVHHWVFATLLVGLAALLVVASQKYHRSWDLTANARTSLSRGSQEVLAKLEGPVTIAAYTSPKSDTARAIRDFLAPWLRAKPDLRLEFVDPDEAPHKVREAGVRLEGEMVIHYGDRKEHLATATESALANALLRLARDRERLVVWLDGHGERKLDGNANFDLGQFGRALAARGFRLLPLNLALAQDMPANAAVLVVASPRTALLPREVDKILAHVARGGHLLWLLDPGPLFGLAPLAEALGLTLPQGVIHDPEAQKLDASVVFAVGSSYGPHPITATLDMLTLFPYARPLVFDPDGTKEWRYTPLVETAPRGWLDEEIASERPKDRPDAQARSARNPGGPYTVALAAERTRDGRNQRVVVAGSGEFLANQYVGNGGNLDLGLAMVEWLAGTEALISVAPRPTIDAQVRLTNLELTFMAVGFLVFLPALFATIGLLLWWRRRKH